jgi:hypothetical protein
MLRATNKNGGRVAPVIDPVNRAPPARPKREMLARKRLQRPFNLQQGKRPVGVIKPDRFPDDRRSV